MASEMVPGYNTITPILILSRKESIMLMAKNMAISTTIMRIKLILSIYPSLMNMAKKMAISTNIKRMVNYSYLYFMSKEWKENALNSLKVDI